MGPDLSINGDPNHQPQSRPDSESLCFPLPPASLKMLEDIDSLVRQGAWLGVINSKEALRYGRMALCPVPAECQKNPSHVLAQQELVIQRALDCNVIDPQQAEKLREANNLEAAKVVAAHLFIKEAARLGLHTGVIDEDLVDQVTSTKSLDRRCAKSAQVVLFIADLEHRSEEMLKEAVQTRSISPGEAERIAAVQNLLERYDDLEKVEMRIRVGSYVERTLQRGVDLQVITPDRAIELRAIEDLDSRYKDVGYVQVLADLKEEMNKVDWKREFEGN